MHSHTSHLWKLSIKPIVSEFSHNEPDVPLSNVSTVLPHRGSNTEKYEANSSVWRAAVSQAQAD